MTIRPMLPLFFIALFCGLCAASAQPAAPHSQYNVLFISVDDLRPELGAYGARHIQSPNIDRLAKSGLVVDRAYCQMAICGPTRASLLTGLRPDSTRIYGLHNSFREFVPNAVTLPQHFKNHGYFTKSFNKIFHILDEQSWSVPSWNSVTLSPRGYALPENMEIYNKNKTYGPLTERADVPDNAYVDGQAVEEAIKTMNEVKDRPFFLGVGFYRPHLPFSAPEKYWRMYDPKDITVPPRDLPLHSPSVARIGFGTGEARVYSDGVKEGHFSTEQSRNMIHGYYASVSFMDAQVGKLLDELKRLGLEQNTIVILWGDHGWKLGDYGEWSKRSNMEADLRAPLIISTPAMRAKGQHTPALVEFVDIYPTLCEVAGLPVPTGLQGRSFARLLDNPKAPYKPAAFSQTDRPGGYMGYSMRTDRFRYTEWTKTGIEAPVGVELYDHLKDPGETVNVADDPTYQKMRAKLKTFYDEAKRNKFTLEIPSK